MMAGRKMDPPSPGSPGRKFMGEPHVLDIVQNYSVGWDMTDLEVVQLIQD